MKKCLLLISFFFAMLVCEAQVLKLPTGKSGKYAMNIIMDKRGGVTGICILRDSGAEVFGSVVNEFGIKAFDFVYNKKKDKTKLRNVIKMLNKWYIRKIVSNDLSVVVRGNNTEKQLRKRRLTCGGDSIVLENTKYNITYKFHRIDDTEQ